MINNKKVLAIIPARGGSKGLPGKNIKLLGGKPLINWTVEAALACAFIDKTIVTTDCRDIADIAAKSGADIPFIRPGELAADNTSSADVVQHAIDSLNESFDLIILLQPTSPFRTGQHISDALTKCAKENNYTAISVCASDKSPAWMFWCQDNMLKPILGEQSSAIRRQDIEQAYALNGAIYVVPVDRFKRYQKFLFSDSLPFIMDKKSSVDIDDAMDFRIAELILADN